MKTNLVEKNGEIHLTDLESAHAWDERETRARLQRDNSPEKKHLDEIRRISNVIQALENLVVQCEEVEGFLSLQNWAKGALDNINLQLRERIHAI